MRSSLHEWHASNLRQRYMCDAAVRTAQESLHWYIEHCSLTDHIGHAVVSSHADAPSLQDSALCPQCTWYLSEGYTAYSCLCRSDQPGTVCICLMWQVVAPCLTIPVRSCYVLTESDKVTDESLCRLLTVLSMCSWLTPVKVVLLTRK